MRDFAVYAGCETAERILLQSQSGRDSVVTHNPTLLVMILAILSLSVSIAVVMGMVIKDGESQDDKQDTIFLWTVIGLFGTVAVISVVIMLMAFDPREFIPQEIL